MSEHTIRVTVNGVEHRREVPAERLLVDFLREDLGLTGTKDGCSVGVCGLCTVLLNGEMVTACLMPAVFADGGQVTTVEGLARDGELTPLQRAFITRGGFQCGICTPGQLVAATALLQRNPHPTEEEVREWMMGNLCRCTGYYQIIESVLAAAQEGSAG